MSEVVRTSTEAVGSMRDALQRFAVEIGNVSADADRALRHTYDQALEVLRRRLATVNHLKAELDRCLRAPGDAPRNCSSIATALAQAERQLADARTAVRAIEQAMTTHDAARARVMRESQALASQGRNVLIQRLGQLALYLAASREAEL